MALDNNRSPVAINNTSTTETEAPFQLNKEKAIKHKIQKCEAEPLTITMENNNNLRIFCNTVTFEGIRQLISHILLTSQRFSTDHRQDNDNSGQTFRDVIKVTDGQEQPPNNNCFTISTFRTTTSFQINGRHISKFQNHFVPQIQEWAEQNKFPIQTENKIVKEALKKLQQDNTPQSSTHPSPSENRTNKHTPIQSPLLNQISENNYVEATDPLHTISTPSSAPVQAEVPNDGTAPQILPAILSSTPTSTPDTEDTSSPPKSNNHQVPAAECQTESPEDVATPPQSPNEITVKKPCSQWKCDTCSKTWKEKPRAMIKCDTCSKAFCQTITCTAYYQKHLAAFDVIKTSIWNCSNACHQTHIKKGDKHKKELLKCNQKLEVLNQQVETIRQTNTSLELTILELNKISTKDREKHQKVILDISATKSAAAEKINQLNSDFKSHKEATVT